MSPATCLILADLVLAAHAALVLCVILMVPAAWVGRWRKWRWTANRWLRGAHLLTIAFIAVQSWLGRICPLTTLEMDLRRRAGDATYEMSFVQHWAERIFYPGWPLWAFIAAYSGFFALVLLTLRLAPVNWRGKK